MNIQPSPLSSSLPGTTTSGTDAPTENTSSTPATSTTPATTVANNDNVNNNNNDNKESSTNKSNDDKSSNPNPTPNQTPTQTVEPEAAIVLAYLKKLGLGTAALELQKHLDEANGNSSSSSSSSSSTNKKAKLSETDDKESKNDNKKDDPSNKKDNVIDVDDTMDIDTEASNKVIERKIDEAKEKKTLFNRTTGGGTGYDLDVASELIVWTATGPTKNANANKHATDSTTTSNNTANDNKNNNNTVYILEGDKEEDMKKQQAAKDENANTTNKEDKPASNDREEWEQDEATLYVRAFTSLQTWVLTLPNDDDNGNSIERVLYHAKKNASLLDSAAEAEATTTTETTNDTNDNKVDTESITNKEQEGTGAHVIPMTNSATKIQQISLMPRSIKPELISLCFPLFIHTYCNLLQSGLEDTAHNFLSTYRHIHEPYHPEEFLDLDKCSSQSQMKKINALIKGYNDGPPKAKALRKMKDKMHQVQQEQQKQSSSSSSSNNNNNNNSTPEAKIIKNIEELEKEYKKVVDEYSECQHQLKPYPFLKRARSVKWHLNLSSLTFHMLARFFRSGDRGGIELLPMSGMLQSKCHLIVEDRDPVPFVPGFILEDMVGTDTDRSGINLIQDDEESDNNSQVKSSSTKKRKVDDIRWAAPVDMASRLLEAGEDITNTNSILKSSERLPFPDYYLKSQYAKFENYKEDEKKVQFNHALLLNGFRRLEALEIKREYEVGLRVKRGSKVDDDVKNLIGNPMKPSIMFSTICASSSTSVHDKKNGTNFPLNESSIDLTCAKLCLPDGRHVAAGCSDSAVRVWSMKSWNSYSGKDTVDDSGGMTSPRESTLVLVGHKKGLPVYDVDWNRDGRTLLSAGGDGTIRLWDSDAVGPFGKLASVTRTKSTNLSRRVSRTVYSEPGTHVPNAKPESTVERHGAALSVYQGHAKSTPVWSVAMAPSGYYFASAGSDSTARLWCTDRPTPVRIFIGHFSQNVNCLSWHPNGNYLVTGSNDKTVRMWDVQSGRSVRILSGCKFGVNQVKVSPSGQYVAGADYGGIVSIWDIRNGRKLNEFKHIDEDTGLPPIIHSMSYSPCGSTLATGGEDRSIRIWDVRGLGNTTSNPDYAASVGWGQNGNHLASTITSDSKSDQSGQGKRHLVNKFYTSGSIILDLEFTKRNLLLSVGKYTPVTCV